MTNCSITNIKSIIMKYSVILIAIAMFIACKGKSNHDFTITGKIKNYTGDLTLYTSVLDLKTQEFRDTAYKVPVNADGNFNITIKADRQDLYVLYWSTLKKFRESSIVLVNDTSNIIIDGDAEDKKTFSIKNSKTSNAILDMERFIINQELLLERYLYQSDSIKKRSSSNALNAYDLKIKELQVTTKNQLLEYYNKANNPFIQVNVLGNMSDIIFKQLGPIANIDKKEFLTLINQSASKYPDNKYLTLFKKQMDAYSNQESMLKNETNNKRKIPSFSLPNTQGKTISIDEFKGKYFLLDFWASWCGYCRQESPYLVKVYNQFKDKNFTIVSISLDEDKSEWLRAIQQDKYTWTQLGDLKGYGSEVARLFNINALPSSFLIDPQGNIIATDLRGNMLEQQLTQLLNK